MEIQLEKPKHNKKKEKLNKNDIQIEKVEIDTTGLTYQYTDSPELIKKLNELPSPSKKIEKIPITNIDNYNKDNSKKDNKDKNVVENKEPINSNKTEGREKKDEKDKEKIEIEKKLDKKNENNKNDTENDTKKDNELKSKNIKNNEVVNKNGEEKEKIKNDKEDKENKEDKIKKEENENFLIIETTDILKKDETLNEQKITQNDNCDNEIKEYVNKESSIQQQQQQQQQILHNNNSNNTIIDQTKKEASNTIESQLSNININENINYKNVYPIVNDNSLNLSNPINYQNTSIDGRAFSNIQQQQSQTSSVLSSTPLAPTLFPPEYYIDNNQDFVFVPTAPTESILLMNNETDDDGDWNMDKYYFDDELEFDGKTYYDNTNSTTNYNIKDKNENEKIEGKNYHKMIYDSAELEPLNTYPLTSLQLQTMAVTLHTQDYFTEHTEKVNTFMENMATHTLPTTNPNAFFTHILHYEERIGIYLREKVAVERRAFEINRNIDHSWKFEKILKNISRTCGDGVRFSYQYLTEIAGIDESVMTQLTENLKWLDEHIEILAQLQFEIELEKKWIDQHIHEFIYYSNFMKKVKSESTEVKDKKKENGKNS